VANDTADGQRGEVRPRYLEAAVTAPLDGRRQGVASVPRVSTETVRAAPHGMRTVDVAAHDDMQAGTGRPAGLFGELQTDAVERHGVVLGDDTPVVFTQDLLEIDLTEWHERRSRVGGGRVKVAL